MGPELVYIAPDGKYTLHRQLDINNFFFGTTREVEVIVC